MSDPNDEDARLASTLIAAAHRLLDLYNEDIILWRSDSSEYDQRCALCGLWISKGDPIKSVYHRERSAKMGHAVGDYAHDACPLPDQSAMLRRVFAG